ncbi:DoxX-like family protein, partial [Herbaspirillum chlorophenolicum]
MWTAATSWFFYPHATSLEWLRTLGLTYQTEQIFFSACLLDAALGLASLFSASRRLWQVQSMVVITYSVVIAIWLP